MLQIILIVAIGFGVYWLITHKRLQLGNMILITGGVKSGKSMLSVYTSIRLHKREHFKWRVNTFLCKIFHKRPPEEPLLYSNVPLRYRYYTPLTEEHLRRQKRFAYKSVVYVQEASLVADSMTIKDGDLNEAMLLLNKLIAHETKGGYIVYDTQSILDNHYSVKRCLNTYLNIHHCIKALPFVCILKVREMAYDEVNTTNIVSGDVEDDLVTVIVPKRVWKLYDRYCYSAMTDHLPRENEEVRAAVCLKATNILTLKRKETRK